MYVRPKKDWIALTAPAVRCEAKGIDANSIRVIVGREKTKVIFGTNLAKIYKIEEGTRCTVYHERSVQSHILFEFMGQGAHKFTRHQDTSNFYVFLSNQGLFTQHFNGQTNFFVKPFMMMEHKMEVHL